MFKSRRKRCFFAFLCHRMSCKDPRKAACTNKYKTLQEAISLLKVLVVFHCLLSPEFLHDCEFRGECLHWGWMKGGCEMPTSPADPEHQPVLCVGFVAQSALLNSVTKRTHLSLHSSAECCSPSSLGTQSLLICWGFPFWFLITTYRPVRCWWQHASMKEETPQTLAFPACRFPRDDDNRETGNERCLCWCVCMRDSKSCGFCKNKVAVPLFCYRNYVSCILKSVLKLLYKHYVGLSIFSKYILTIVQKKIKSAIFSRSGSLDKLPFLFLILQLEILASSVAHFLD